MNLHANIDGALIALNEGAVDTAKTILTDVKQYLEEREAAGGRFVTAAKALSFSEQEAALAVMDELDDAGGLVVASKIADRKGMTRGVFVNMFRKLESAGIIVTHSLGQSGTRIKPLVPGWREGLKKAFAA